MRARSLKPSLFKNELLAVADPLHTVVFSGLWCLADREGRLEDRPARIHFDVNPGRPFDGTCRALDWLAQHGFIVRYEADGKRLIQVVNFAKHQNPHCKEAPSTLPAPCEHSASTVLAVLTPDSGLLTPDSGLLTACPPDKGARKRATPRKRCPEDWNPPESALAAIRAECPDVDLQAETRKFRDHEFARGRSDWLATWRNWIREAQTRAANRPRPIGQPPPKRPPPTEEQILAARREAAEANRRELAAKIGGVLRAIP